MKKFFYIIFMCLVASCSKDRSIILPVVVSGCTNPNAQNYNHEATEDDGSCLFLGCTDVIAVNFDPDANIDDGSCEYEGLIGCNDPAAINYSPEAIGCGESPDSTNTDCCVYVVLGCTDPLASNYNPEANVDDGSCEYLVSFNNDLLPLFESRCMPCHAPGQQPPQLVDGKFAYGSTLNYVDVENAENSVLYQSVNGDLDLVMPLGSNPLSQEEIDLILSWIQQGAYNN
tara:strand:+ start:144 stop:830 length:687 start_codon:yes stop_codon:yes gene_type:complete